MSNMKAILCGICIAWPATTSVAQATGFAHVLQPGRYKIEVVLEDLKTGQQQTLQQVERCLASEAIANHVIFEILSDTTASECSKYEICAGETRTGFIAQCMTGPSAVGMFALEQKHFRGRIEIKNQNGQLTHVELQFGERIGDCLENSGAKPD